MEILKKVQVSGRFTAFQYLRKACGLAQLALGQAVESPTAPVQGLNVRYFRSLPEANALLKSWDTEVKSQGKVKNPYPITHVVKTRI